MLRTHLHFHDFFYQKEKRAKPGNLQIKQCFPIVGSTESKVLSPSHDSYLKERSYLQWMSRLVVMNVWIDKTGNVGEM
jgi:hypothetical protein